MLTLRNITFSYRKNPVLENFSMDLTRGEILALMGPSGCGKTTLLRLIAGLEKPSEGICVKSFQRISYMFQEPRLFPWMTVRENLRAVLTPRQDNDAKIDTVLQQVEIPNAAMLYPDELSGGMKSRVALARALLYGGDLYLLDEPFAALDEALRLSLSGILRTHIKESGASAIFVTHQEADAQMIADRIITL